MKKNNLSYVAPEVELVEMAVENGFAASLESVSGFGLNEGADYGDEVDVW